VPIQRVDQCVGFLEQAAGVPQYADVVWDLFGEVDASGWLQPVRPLLELWPEAPGECVDAALSGVAIAVEGGAAGVEEGVVASEAGLTARTQSR